MIERLKVRNFTSFKAANFAFAGGVNVVLGSNGTGKSHLLKLAYTSLWWGHEMAVRERARGRPDKVTLQRELAAKLVSVFGADSLGRLSRRGTGVQRTEVDVAMRPAAGGFKFSFSTKSATEVVLDPVPDGWPVDRPVFLPTKEMLSLFPGFAGLYRTFELSIDETYYDLCIALDRPLLRGRRLEELNDLLAPVEAVLQGKVKSEQGRFYLVQQGQGKFEISLVAEGFRKLGMVAYLLANGVLAEKSVLFWDEPETNLNPKYMVDVAQLLAGIARLGTQVFVATHSLFLTRELSLRLGRPENAEVDRRFFALARGTDGNVTASVGHSADEVEPIDALDAEIDQSKRYLAGGGG